MDYYNNDFQTQNFHLDSDENTKFPSFLQSYALPKFDLDEHLQVRLQFGSVVDSEVLLGDQNQKENNWIENISRVNSGIEIGSHATASCSSLRRKNVWSEAASSETVEMLLKSVGQDSVIIRRSTVEESNTFDALDSVDNKMERPTFNQDDSVHSKVMGTADADSTPPSEKISARLSSKYFQECQSVECLPLRSKDDKCGCVNSRDLDLSSVDQKFGFNVNHTVEKCGLVPEEASLRSYEVKVAGANVDFVVSERMQIGPSASSGHNIVIDSKRGCNELVSCGNQEWLVEDASQKGKHQILKQDGGTDNRHSEEHDVKSRSNDLGGSCSSALKVGSLEQIKASPVAVLSEKVGEISYSDANHMDSNGLSNFMNSGNQSVESMLIDLSSAVREVGRDKVDLGTGATQAAQSATTCMEDVVGGVTVGCRKLLLGDKLENLQEDVSQQGLVQVLGQHSHIDETHRVRLEGQGSSNVETSHSSVPKTSSLLQKTLITDILLSEKLGELLTAHTDLMDLKALRKDGKMGNAGCLTEEASSAATEGKVKVNRDHVECKIQGCASTTSAEAMFVCNREIFCPVISHDKPEGPVVDDLHKGKSEIWNEGTQPPDKSVGCNILNGIVSRENNRNSVLSKGGETDDQTVRSMPLVTEGDRNVVRRFVKKCKGLMESPFSAMSNMDYAVRRMGVSNGAFHKKPDVLINNDSHQVESQMPSKQTGIDLQSRESKVGTLSCTEGIIDKKPDVLMNNDSQQVESRMPSKPTGIDLQSRESKVGTLSCTEGKIEGDLLNHYEGSSSRPIKLSENTVQPHSMEDVGRNLSSSEPHCGQLTAIDCSKALQGIKEFRDCTVEVSSCKNILLFDGACQIDRETGTICSNALSSKNNSPQEERSSAFVVGSSEVLSRGISTKGQNSSSNIQGFETHKKNSFWKHQVSGEQKACGTTKVSGASKSRSESGGAPGKNAIVAGRKRAKEEPLPKTTKKVGVSCSVLADSNGSKNGLVQEEEVTQNAFVQDKSKKSCVATAQMATLPDLNTSASPITIFQQPFTDFQQVQLRAQIFVYGSLIQATAPNEACMISAFADTSWDGGQSMWENVWRVATERTGNQKSTLTNPEAPVQSHSGTRNSKSSPIQNLSVSSSSCRSVSRGTPSAVVNPFVSSATWNFPNPHDGLPLSSMCRSSPVDSHQRLSPLHSSPTVHIRPSLSNSTLQSQVPGRVASHTSVVDIGKCLSTSPIFEAIKVTSVRDSSTQCTSSLRLVSSSPLTLSGDSANVLSSENLPIEEKRTTTEKHASADQITKKRKKSSVAEVSAQISPVIHPQSEPVCSTALTKSLTISECIISPSPSAAVGVSGVLASTSSPIASSMHYQVVGCSNTDRRVIFPKETCSQIEHAKLHAENAASLADSAVKHQESVWNLLAAHKSSGFLSDVEEKLASAAVAAAVAASVAKAAAAAAKVASNVALQAKLMADEALVIRDLGHPGQDSGLGLPDVDKNLGRVSPASVLKGMDISKNSSAVIIAARETTRRRVEATSAAAKRAENLDAVVKAAELASEAVSQVGIVVAMGDPIPLRLTELVEAGPDGYWKAQQHSSEHPMKVSGIHFSKQLTTGSNGSHDINDKSSKEQPSSQREIESTDNDKTNGTKDPMVELVDKHIEPVNTSPEHPVLEADDRTELPPLTAQNDEDERPQLSGTSNEIKLSNENDIKEGSLVEVVSDEDGLRGVWFSARVLSLQDGKAYVSYMDLLQDEGRGQLKEWIPVEVVGDKAPRIRIAHPMTAMNFEGTRKRRRAAIGNYGWSVGDHVDVWMRDGWWEGVVTEKNSSDGTKYTIHFPADGDLSVVRAWNLRPSLMWKDGRWIEWSREKNYFPREGATPEVKRQKLDQDEAQNDYLVEAKGNKHSENFQAEGSGEAEESRTLTDENFMVMKNWEDVNISDTVKMKRIGLQKEGSRVVFGIPKPGKKRKFMEVSKNYIADGVATTIGGASTMKFGKYVVPHGSNDDYKEKKTFNSRRVVFDCKKDQSFGSKHTTTEDGSSVSMVSSSSGCIGEEPSICVKASVNCEENNLENLNHLEVGSRSNNIKTTEASVLYLILELDSDVHSFTEGSFSDKVECGSKGKQTVVGENFARDGENIEKGYSFTGSPLQDGTEPRRSSRRIQPTSRLLEGLQSSFLISQIPALSHGKSAKAQYRSVLSSRGSDHR